MATLIKKLHQTTIQKTYLSHIGSKLNPNNPPAVLSDGNTEAWYECMTEITKDVNDYVSAWNDKSGNNRHLVQPTTANQPLWTNDGVLFDGVDDWMSKSFGSIIPQPIVIYLHIKQVSWTLNDYIFDSTTNMQFVLTQKTSSPGIGIYAGTANTVKNDGLQLNEFGVLKLEYNGANSGIKINDSDMVSCSAGINSLAGLTLGSFYGKSNYYSNIQIKELIVRSKIDNESDSLLIYNYLTKKTYKDPVFF